MGLFPPIHSGSASKPAAEDDLDDFLKSLTDDAGSPAAGGGGGGGGRAGGDIDDEDLDKMLG